VALLKNEGAGFIKVFGSLSREAYFAIVEEAKRLGLPVSGHVPILVTPQEVSIAGQRCIEHAGRFPIPCKEGTVEQLQAAARTDTTPRNQLARAISACTSYNQDSAEVLATLLAKNNTYVVPTLVQRVVYDVYSGDSARFATALRFTPVWHRREWAKDIVAGQASTVIAKAMRSVSDGRMAYIRTLHKAGVTIMAGTDSPNFPYAFPGFGLHQELELLVQCGLTPIEALRSATLTPAKFLGLENAFGTVEQGKTADLILLNDNPLENISNTQKIEAVVVNGRLLRRSDLDALLLQVENMARK